MSVRLLWPFLDVARQAGRPNASREVAMALGVSEEELEHPDSRVPLRSVANLLARAIDVVGNRNIGLDAARLTDSAHVGIGEYLARYRPTMARALETGERYSALLGDGAHFGVVMRGERAYWQLWFDPKVVMPDAAYEFALALGVLSVRRITGMKHLAPIEVHFSHGEPSDTSPHRELFGCPVRFGMPAVQIVMSSGFLKRSLADADPTLARFLERQADTMLESVSNEGGVATAVRAQLRSHQPLGQSTAEAVARQLGLSLRSLARRLSQEGTGYRELLDEVRQERARALLSHSQRSLAEIAEDLGFASSQGFQRAFRRWTGTTPSRYRSDAGTDG